MHHLFIGGILHAIAFRLDRLVSIGIASSRGLIKDPGPTEKLEAKGVLSTLGGSLLFKQPRRQGGSRLKPQFAVGVLKGLGAEPELQNQADPFRGRTGQSRGKTSAVQSRVGKST